MEAEFSEDPVVAFLLEPRPGSADDLVRAFARYLIDQTACYSLPISLNTVRKFLKLPVRRVPLPGQRGLTTDDRRIFLNADDRRTVQKFTLAHEFMEVLFLAIEAGKADDWIEDDVLAACHDRKETLCDIGAAELIMPLHLFSAMVGQGPVTLPWACDIATQCQVSLTATLWRIIEHGLAPRIMIVWQYKHKPREYVPSVVGQLNFFGPPELMDPPKKMRVERVFVPPTFHDFIPTNKSVPAASVINCAFREGVNADGIDDLDVGPLRGRYFVEAMPFSVEGERRVLSLIHLDQDRVSVPA